MIRNWLLADTTTVVTKGISVEFILTKVIDKQRTLSYSFFVKQSEGDLVHM